MTPTTAGFANHDRHADTALRSVPRPTAASDALVPGHARGRPAAPGAEHQAEAPGRRAATSSDTSVGREIRVIRRRQGRTLKDLARVIGVTGAQLHRYETGATRIAASRLISIAHALGVGADALIVAGCDQPETTAAVPSGGSDDIIELIELFGAITDPRHRSALVAVARMMALPYRPDGAPGEG